VAGVVVTLSSASGGEQTAVTDANGVFTFKDLPAGTYQVRFKKSAFKPIARDVALESGKTFTADAEMVAQEPATSPPVATRGSSSVTGVALDTQSKQPVGDVVVTLTSPSLPEGEQIVVTDASGAFAFTNLPAGSYQIRFEGSTVQPLSRNITIGGRQGLHRQRRAAPRQAGRGDHRHGHAHPAPRGRHGGAGHHRDPPRRSRAPAARRRAISSRRSPSRPAASTPRSTTAATAPRASTCAASAPTAPSSS
jgi:hypothetical protein